ncbi:MAG: T9SS type A sorting domain-containing protein [Ignavibacteria bacterium]
MKLLKISLLLFLLLFTLSLKSQWTFEGRLDNNGLFNYISVVDSGTVWTVGEAWSGDSSIIYRRSPGGLWKSIPTNSIIHNHELTCIAAIDSLTAFVATGNGNNNGYSYLYKTTNAGLNWFAQITLAGNRGYFNDIRFSKKNPAYGYAWSDPPQGNGSPFKIFKTTNYGVNWIEYSIQIDTHYVGYAVSICVTDSVHAWFGLFRNRTSSDPNGKVLYTTNGGLDFLVATIPASGESVNTLEFKHDNSFGFATIDFQYNNYYKSTNGGISWISQFSSYGFGSAMRVISIPNSNIWYVSTNFTGPTNRFFKSTNDGTTWVSMIEPNLYFSIEHMDAVTSDNNYVVYAVGLDGQILRLSDTTTVIGINPINSEVPTTFRLYQNYPNPFNPTTMIAFDIPKDSYASLKIFNSLGQEVVVLIDGSIKAGVYQKMFNASALPSGIYFYKFVSEGFSEVRKMSLIK